MKASTRIVTQDSDNISANLEPGGAFRLRIQNSSGSETYTALLDAETVTRAMRMVMAKSAPPERVELEVTDLESTIDGEKSRNSKASISLLSLQLLGLLFESLMPQVTTKTAVTAGNALGFIQRSNTLPDFRLDKDFFVVSIPIGPLPELSFPIQELKEALVYFLASESNQLTIPFEAELPQGKGRGTLRLNRSAAQMLLCLLKSKI